MISFIILNYYNVNDTIECINSIKKIKSNKKISIIVVDNNSCNEYEKNILCNISDHAIFNDDNIGFAKGNNIGCNYAINTYNPDFLCVVNNDVLIEQEEFVDLIYSTFEKTNFDVLGPKIMTNDGFSTNPFPAYETLDDIKKNLKKAKYLIYIYKSVILRNLLNLYIYIKSLYFKKYVLDNSDEKMMKDVPLHGCALIFSKKYYEKYKYVFYPNTFLNHEEEFLNFKRIFDKLLFVYNPELKLFHKEGASFSNKYGKNYYKKLIFKNRSIVGSLTELLKYLEKDGDRDEKRN